MAATHNETGSSDIYCNLVTALVSRSCGNTLTVGWNDKTGVRFLLSASRMTLKTTSLLSTGCPVTSFSGKKSVKLATQLFTWRYCMHSYAASEGGVIVNEELQEM